MAALICGRTHSTTSTKAQEPQEELVTYCPAAKQSKDTVQHRLGSPGHMTEETDDTPQSPSSPAQGLQYRPQGRTERPGARSHDEGCRPSGGWTHRAGHVVNTTWPPGGLMDGQPTKVQSSMTLKPRADSPVNRSQSLIQVRPQSQFSNLAPRNGDGLGPWGTDHSKLTQEQPQPLPKGPRALCW